MPQGYNKTQIRLHWVIFILIVLQFLLHEPMSDGWDIIEKGGEPEPNIMVLQHIVGGLLVLVLVLWRLSIRVRRGAPALPAEEPAIS